jgi:L-ascorbate metabolism protein UlaG (beta-lactamase superfamily)
MIFWNYYNTSIVVPDDKFFLEVAGSIMYSSKVVMIKQIFITYLGTASFLIESDNFRILTDPGDFFTNRFTVKKARSLGRIDLVIITHSDFDHVNRLKYIPDAVKVPVFGNENLNHLFPGYNIITGEEFISEGISVKKVKSIHGIRHYVKHISFIVTIGNIVICFLGDAYKITGNIPGHIDLLFAAISGIEASPANAVRLASVIKPEAIIPMHWEKIFRNKRPVSILIKKLKVESPQINYYVPEYDRRFEVIKEDKLLIK